MPNDLELLRRYAREGSQEAFAELVRRRVDLVYSIALRGVGGDKQAAEDVVQAVFRDLARKASRLCQHPALSGWFFTSTRYAADHERRAASRRLKREQAAFEVLSEPTDLFRGDQDWSRLGPVIDHLLSRLGKEDRLAILLRFYEGRAYSEIAREFAGSEDGARMRVQRALERLRRQLKSRGISSSTVALAAMLTEGAVNAAPVGLAAQVATVSAAGVGSTLATSLASLIGMAKLSGMVAAVAALSALGIWQWKEQTKLDAGFRELGLERQQLTDERRRAAPLATHPVAALPARPKGGAITPLANDEYMRRYALFFRERSMTGEQIDRFIALLRQRAQNGADLQDAVRKEGLVDGPGVETLRSQMDEPVRQGLRDLLGDEGSAAYGAYERSSYFRMGWVEPLNAYFSASAVALTDVQAEELTQLFAANDHPTKIVATDLGDESTIDWDALVAESTRILTPVQQAIIAGRAVEMKSLQEQNLARLRAARGISMAP
jgi:RNA polymerase sigma factor (sigma-70 family)